MPDNDRYLRLSRLLNPRSIVFVGGGALEPAIDYTRTLGFNGDYHVINPNRDELCGIACVRSAAEIKSPPDLAFVAVPGAAAIEAVRNLAQAGVGAAVVNTSGFSEAGRDGAGLQAQLLEAAGEMPFMGPNCPGFANFLDRVSGMLDHMGDSNANRGVAVLSNGGAYLTDMTYADRSLPIALIAGLGNQANVSIADLLEVVLDDDRVTAVNLHLESIRSVQKLSECALKAHQKGIPIVAVKAGKTRAGQRAAQTHTASLTGDAEIASALFSRLGFVEVDSVSEALETLKMLTLAPAPKGPRMAFTTSSGTYSVMGSDFAEKNGLILPQSSAETQQTLQPLIHDFLVADNPLDIATAQFWADEDQRKIFDAFLGDDYDIAAQTMFFPPENTWEDESWYRSARQFAEAAHQAGIPAVFISPTQEGLPKPAREMLIELGVAPLQGFEAGMKAVAQALGWHLRRKSLSAETLLLPEPPPTSSAAVSQLDEAESKALLHGFGVPVPEGQRWQGSTDPPPGLRYPVVLKVCDASILHKAKLGGVSLNLASPDLLIFAREQMIASLAEHGYQAEQFLIEEPIHGAKAELLVGIRQVPGIGYSLTLAVGGSAVEMLGDATTLLLPVNRDMLNQALEGLRLYPTLIKDNGGSGADIDAALDVIEAICGFVQSRNDIIELEINPLLLRSEGHGAVAVDAVMKLKTQ